MKRRRAWSAGAVLAALIGCFPSAALAGPIDVVSTIAGSGRPGNADGSALQATFLMPSAIAADSSGNVYVADAAGQRIRVVARNGAVRTLAGGGPAGYNGLYVDSGTQDGSRSAARFFTPMGIAVAADGTVYVSDTNNGAIRAISRDGAVRTFVRGLGLPRQIALGPGGAMFVADAKKGVLRISPDGQVSVLPLDVTEPLGVAVYDGHGAASIFVSDVKGITVSHLDGSARIRYFNAQNVAQPGGVGIEGGHTVGTPFQLLALGPDAVAYTDLRSHTVRFLSFVNNISFGIAGSTDEDAVFEGGGFRDGPGPSARFDAPMGIAAAPDGSILIADAGNRRVRRISGFDKRQVLRDPGGLLAERVDRTQYRVLYLGASTTWWATSWAASIPATVETAIASDVRQRARKTARVVPVQMVGSNIDAFSSYLDTVADTGLIDAVVLQLNDTAVPEHQTDPANWKQEAGGKLRALQAKLAAAHIPLLVVGEPLALQLDPIELAWKKTTENSYLPAWPHDEQDWREMAQIAGVPFVDMWAPLLADLRSPAHEPIFGTDDEHLAVHGRALFGRSIASALLKLHPWRP